MGGHEVGPGQPERGEAGPADGQASPASGTPPAATPPGGTPPAATPPAATPPAATPAAAARPGWLARLRGTSRVRLAAIGGAVVAVIVGLSVAGATVASGHPASRPLTPAKNFTLEVLGHPSRHISLASLAGRPVILNFFASWCIPCQRETPLIARFYRTGHAHLAVIGIDVNDAAGAAEAFVDRKGVRYPVAVDPLPMKTAIAYNLPGLPATFFLNARHQVVKRVYGALTPASLAAGAKLMTQRGK
jgi:cytochrome c biogenesis protein CcmG/thiol:disulfide interchange protein DsbE